jgi:hypothetical protein
VAKESDERGCQPTRTVCFYALEDFKHGLTSALACQEVAKELA